LISKSKRKKKRKKEKKLQVQKTPLVHTTNKLFLAWFDSGYTCIGEVQK